MLETLLRWMPVLIAVALPFWGSAVALLLQQAWDRRPARPRIELRQTAIQWLRERVVREAPGIALQTHGQPGLDAFWPGVDAIALSTQTARSHAVLPRAIAAHELGHAVNFRSHPLARQVLPVARLVEELSWRGFGASLLVLALLGLPGAVWPAVGFAIATAVAGAVVVLDEGWASVRAEAWLRSDPTLPRAGFVEARRALLHAWSVYAARFVGQLVVVCALPPLLRHAAGLREAEVVAAIDPVGAWVLFFALPFLVLRALWVLRQVLAPDPVASDFRMFTLLQTEAQWESLTSTVVLAVLFLLHDHAGGAGFGAAVALAAVVALGPVSAIGRALILFPGLLAIRRWARDRAGADDALFADARPDQAVPAMMALYSEPPWYLRLSWLTNLAWVPMIGWLVVQLAL